MQIPHKLQSVLVFSKRVVDTVQDVIYPCVSQDRGHGIDAPIPAGRDPDVPIPHVLEGRLVLAPPHTQLRDPAQHERKHLAHVPYDELERGEAVEQPARDKAEDVRRDVRVPSERAGRDGLAGRQGEVAGVERRELRRGRPRRVQVDGHVEVGRRGPEREVGRVVVVGAGGRVVVDQRADEAELADAAREFGGRGRGVGDREHGEPCEAAWDVLDRGGELVVGRLAFGRREASGRVRDDLERDVSEVHLGEPEGGEIGQFVREAGDVFELFRVLRGDGRGGGCGVGEEVFLQGYERRDHGRRLSHPVGRFETGRDGKTKEMDQAKDDQTNKNLGGAGESSDVC